MELAAEENYRSWLKLYLNSHYGREELAPTDHLHDAYQAGLIYREHRPVTIGKNAKLRAKIARLQEKLRIAGARISALDTELYRLRPRNQFGTPTFVTAMKYTVRDGSGAYIACFPYRA